MPVFWPSYFQNVKCQIGFAFNLVICRLISVLQTLYIAFLKLQLMLNQIISSMISVTKNYFYKALLYRNSFKECVLTLILRARYNYKL